MFRSLAITLTLCLATATVQAALVTYEYQALLTSRSGYNGLLPDSLVPGLQVLFSYTFDGSGADEDHLRANVFSISPTAVSVAWLDQVIAYSPNGQRGVEWANDISGGCSSNAVRDNFGVTGAFVSSNGGVGYAPFMMLSSICTSPENTPWLHANVPVTGPLGPPNVTEFLGGNEFSFQAFLPSGQGGAADNVYGIITGGGVVPVPPAAWLFGSALGVIGWMRRKAVA